MFGSLVIIFPTRYEGGEFVLREGDRKWSYDYEGGKLVPREEKREWSLDFFARMLSDSSQHPCVGYVSFFSDVEHEVRTVTSGHRVTITYNLCFIPETQGPLGTISTPAPYERSLAAPFYMLLTDPTVLPRGSHLAFGLCHHCPVEKGTDLVDYKHCLKGTDAALGRTLTFLGVAWEVRVFYRNVGSYNDYIDEVMVDLSGAAHQIFNFNEAMGETAELVEFASIDGIPRVRRHPNAEKPPPQFAKVTKVDSMTFSRLPYVMAGSEYSEEAEIGELYGEVCIIANLDEPTKRIVRKVDSMEVST